MAHIRVREDAHDLADRVGLPDVRQELVAQALALGRAADQPAISMNRTVAGTILAESYSPASAASRWSGIPTMPTFGSMVAKG